MCDQNTCCQKPEQLKGFPGECSPEQVRVCHGDVKGHPCVEEKKQDAGKKHAA